MMRIVHFICLSAVMLALGCNKAAAPLKEPVIAEWRLLESALASEWQQAGIPEEGQIQINSDDELVLAAGQPMTGARFMGWAAAELPQTSYVIQYEALREEGRDFFGTVTFPVGSHDTHASFVLGGWGGTLTGISSIDFLDASENQTRAEMPFQANRWYRVRIEVRPEDLRVWVDGKPVVNANIKGRKVGLRPGDIEQCVPFGFATYATKAKIRNVVIEWLRP